MATAEARLDLTINRFARALGRARGLMVGFARGAGRIGVGLGKNLFGGALGAAMAFGRVVKTLLTSLAVLAAAAGAGMAVGLKKAFDYGSKMSDVAVQIGLAAGEVAVLEEAFRQAGASPDKMAPAVNKLQKSVLEATEGLETYARAFRGIGLDPEELLGMGTAEMFETVANALAAVEDPAERTGRAMQIFGRAGGELMAFFNDAGAIDKARDTLGGQAVVLTQAAGDFDRASDILNSVFVKIRGFFIGFGSKLVAQILPALEAFDDFDLTPIGEKLGDSISGAIDFANALFQTLSLGEIFELATLALKVGLQEAVNVFARAIGAVITMVSGPEAWVALQEALMKAATYFKEEIFSVLGFLEQFQLVEGPGSIHQIEGDKKRILSTGHGGGKLTELDLRNFTEKTLGYYPELAKEGNAPADLFDIGKREAASQKQTVSDLLDRFMKTFSETEGLFDTSELRERIEELTAETRKAAEESRRVRDEETEKRRKGQDAKPELGGAGDDTESEGKQRFLKGGFARAVNLLSGKTVNEFIVEEARKANEYHERTARATEETRTAVEKVKEAVEKTKEIELEVVPTFS